MIQANSISLVLSVACFVSCHKQTPKAEENQSAVKVTNSMALEDSDYMPVVRLGNNCTATFIKPNLMITTANCAKNNNTFTDQHGRDRPIFANFVHPYFKNNDPFNQYNFGLLFIKAGATSGATGGSQPGIIEIDTVRTKNDFEMVGFGCKDQAEPNIRGLKRKGRNVFVKPTSGGNGILSAQGTGMTTMNYDAPHANSIGCLGDEGAPALVDNKIVGVYLGERQINRQRTKEAIFVDLTLLETQVFIKKIVQYSLCNG